MKLDTNNITPCLMVKNEDYWIYYVLRDLVKVFSNVLVLDTGSTDDTKPIIRKYFPDVLLVEHDYGNDANKIGNGRNVMREYCNTYWMFLIDGDEIWREEKLNALLEFEVPDGKDVVMVSGWNVQDVEGKLLLRTNDNAPRDGLFAPSIKWYKTDYPFESYGLSHTFPMERVVYTNFNQIFAWHMRHTLRSSKNFSTYFRKEKLGYYPYSGEFSPLPEDWLGEVNTELYNPYIG